MQFDIVLPVKMREMDVKKGKKGRHDTFQSKVFRSFFYEPLQGSKRFCGQVRLIAFLLFRDQWWVHSVNERSVYVCKHQVKQRDFRKGTTALLAKPQFSLSYNLPIPWQVLTFGEFILAFSLYEMSLDISNPRWAWNMRTKSFRLGKTEAIRVAIFWDNSREILLQKGTSKCILKKEMPKFIWSSPRTVKEPHKMDSKQFWRLLFFTLYLSFLGKRAML